MIAGAAAENVSTGGFGFENAPEEADRAAAQADDPLDLPVGLTLPARLWRALDRARDWRTQTLSPSSVSLMGGGGADIFQAPKDPAPVGVEAMIALAAAWGFSGDGLVHAVEDMLLFEQSFLKQAREDAARRTEAMRR